MVLLQVVVTELHLTSGVKEEATKVVLCMIPISAISFIPVRKKEILAEGELRIQAVEGLTQKYLQERPLLADEQL